MTTTNLPTQRHVWRAEDFTATRISFPKLCAISEIVGAMRGLLEGGALDDLPLTKKSMQAALAKYEAAQ